MMAFFLSLFNIYGYSLISLYQSYAYFQIRSFLYTERMKNIRKMMEVVDKIQIQRRENKNR